MVSLVKKVLCSIVCLSTIVLPAYAVAQEEKSELIVALAEMPVFRLSNLRIGSDDFGRSALLADFELTEKGNGGLGSVYIAGKTKNGELRVTKGAMQEQSGTLRIAMDHSLIGAKDFEIYLVFERNRKQRHLVSNVVRLGNPGPTTRARPLTAKEKAAIEKAKLAATPPGPIPTGLTAVTVQTKLLPGMLVKAGMMAKWEDAEVISFNGTTSVNVKFLESGSIMARTRRTWLAVDPKVLEKGEANPDQFKPSVTTLPGGRLAIVDGAIPLAEDIELPVGTPLVFDYGSRWRDVFVVETKGSDIKLRYKGFSSTWDVSKPRSKFLIKEETLKLLKVPAEVEKFASNVSKETNSKAASSSTGKAIRHKAYPVKIDVPEGSQLVPDDLKVEEGTALSACWANKWHPITSISENDDGSLFVHWDEYSDSFNCNMIRSELIITDATEQLLRKKMKGQKPKEGDGDGGDGDGQPSLVDLKKNVRAWTDVSGQHEIEAVYVSRTEKEITLRTEAGREIKMPIKKLSKKDQSLLESLEPDSENPFAP